VGASYYLTCSLDKTNGAVRCWGKNDYGQLGAGLTDDYSAKPVDVKLNGKALSLSVGYRVACIVDVDGAIECWGDGEWGQLGININTSICNGNSYACSNVPLIIDQIAKSTGNTVSVGGYHSTTFLEPDGRIFTFGDNEYGKFGSGSDSPPYTEKATELYYSWRVNAH
jgi:alpha-tubulin suppressor-like RCC1 family protein